MVCSCASLGRRYRGAFRSAPRRHLALCWLCAGGLFANFATVRYLRTGRAIDRHEYHWSPVLGLALSARLVLVVGALAAYLLLAS